MMFTNAQSLLAHKDEIHYFMMARRNPTIVALAKTRLIADIEDCEVNVLGYSIVRCDGENRCTGGMIIYVRNDIRYEMV